jgi:hypothetical protein
MRLLQTALWLAIGISPALAQRAPVIVIPGRPDVPILMNGVDVSWSVIEGEFGLDRPNEVNPTVIYRPFGVVSALGPPYIPPRSFQPGYFPSTGLRRRPTSAAGRANPHPVRQPHTRRSRRCRAWSTEGGAATGATALGTTEACSATAVQVHTLRGMAGDSFHTIIGRAAPQFVFIRLVNGAACRGVSCLVIALSSWLSPRC